MSNNNKKYDCILCSKSYTSRQNLWKHKNNVHKDSNFEENNNTLNNDILENDILENDILNNENIEDVIIQEDILLCCKYCGKKSSRTNNLNRHMKTCKKAKDNAEANANYEKIKCEIKQEIEDKIKKEIRDELKEEIKNELFKKAKIHPKTLQKINNQLNNINNGIINNNNVTFSFGKENISNIITEEKKIEILNRRLNSIISLIEYMHFNDDFPQFKNILITNMQNNIGYIYNQDTEKFDSVNKDELLEKIIDTRMIDIEDFYRVCKDKLNDATKKKIDVLLEDINKNKFRGEKKEQIKLVIYNNKHKIKNNVQKN